MHNQSSINLISNSSTFLLWAYIFSLDFVNSISVFRTTGAGCRYKPSKHDINRLTLSVFCQIYYVGRLMCNVGVQILQRLEGNRRKLVATPAAAVVMPQDAGVVPIYSYAFPLLNNRLKTLLLKNPRGRRQKNE